MTVDQPKFGRDAVADFVPPPKRVAVIDIGTTSIRMSIGEIGNTGQIRTLEALYQAVDLGRETFTRGAISTVTIEESVKILKRYRELLQQYEIRIPDQIRVVATSAVNEAVNRSRFIDRIYVATGISVEPLDDAEANRYAYLSIQPMLEQEPAMQSAKSIVIEVGGGNTELLIVQGTDVDYAHTYRLGSLRLRHTFEAHRASSASVRNMMESHINRTIDQVRHELTGPAPTQMVALGGDMRFAAGQIVPDWNPDRLGNLPVTKLAALTETILRMTPDEVVRKYHLSFSDAETLGPALLTYLKMALEFKLDHVFVAAGNFRGGVLKEMAFQGRWPDGFSRQITRSALDLGRKYEFDESHALHIAKLSRVLFQALKEEHGLDERNEWLLYIAGLLHDVGNFVSNRSHHKHSMYLIMNSELFGLSRHDVTLIALVARYHRRASPKPLHEVYVTLDREDRIIVAKLAAMLRVADALDRSERQRITRIQCIREKDRFAILVPGVEDLSLEQLALKQKGSMFQEVYGMPVLLRSVKGL